MTVAMPRRSSRSSRSRPLAAPNASNASAPNAQRKNTAVSGCWPASSTKTPSVPSSTPPASISVTPRRSSRAAAAVAANADADADAVGGVVLAAASERAAEAAGDVMPACSAMPQIL